MRSVVGGVLCAGFRPEAVEWGTLAGGVLCTGFGPGAVDWGAPVTCSCAGAKAAVAGVHGWRAVVSLPTAHVWRNR